VEPITSWIDDGNPKWWNQEIIEEEKMPIRIPRLEKIIYISADNNLCLTPDLRGT
jgi:hypothetical protein